MINKMDYVQAAALVKVQEKKMLNRAKINRMVDASSASEILKILSETDYSKSMIGITKEEEYEKILENELKRTYSFAREISKDASVIVDFLELKYIFQTLKKNLKIEIKKKERPEIDERYLAVYEKALDEYEKHKDVQSAVILLDKFYFKELKNISSKIGLKIFKEYYDLMVGSYNLLTFLRLKNQKRTYKYARTCIIDNEELLKIYESDANYVQTLEKIYDNKKIWSEYLKNGRISSIEKELENSLISLVKEYKNVHYGIEPIVTYIIAKEYEIKAIRLIMTAKINKISTDIIKERMRDIYV